MDKRIHAKGGETTRAAQRRRASRGSHLVQTVGTVLAAAAAGIPSAALDARFTTAPSGRLSTACLADLSGCSSSSRGARSAAERGTSK